jgi:zinc protease
MAMPMRGYRLCLLLLVALLSVSVPVARAVAATVPDTPLPVDPAVHMHTLDNGVTYWIRSHATPPGKITFWLYIDTGSVNEDDGQEGIAHYLEHLAFNGSQHFPPGELVKYFESIGLRFGQHQNAFTSFDQTTYTLTLPNTEPDTLDKGLLYLSDVAHRMLLTPEEINQERNVILEEKRARKGVQQRLMDQLLPALLPGSRVAKRLPIGLESSIHRVQRDDFLAYYRKWYHPANVTVLAVGDTPVETIEAAIKKHFAGWTAPGPAPADLDYGMTPFTSSRAIILTDPELTSASVETLAIGPWRPVTTREDYRQQLLERLGTWIVNRRFNQLIQEGNAPYQSADVSIGRLFGVASEISAEAESEPSAWHESLRALISEIKRAWQHGFAAQELDDAKSAFLSAAERAVQTEPTRDAGSFIRIMNRARSAGEQPRSAAQFLKLQQDLLPAITLQDVATVFTETFTPDAIAAIVLLPDHKDVEVPSQNDVLTLVNTVWERPTEPWQGAQRPTALLEQTPTPGAIAERSRDEVLGITHMTFANNVRLHYRYMDFKKDDVTVVITLAGGIIRETATSRGLTSVATLPLSSPATARFSSTALRDFMTGKKVGVSMDQTADTVSLRVSGAPEALEDGLELAYLLLREATIEPASVKLWKREQLQNLEARRTQVSDLTREAAALVLSGNDARQQALTLQQVEARSQEIPQAQAWLDNLLRSAPMEVAIVGDVPIDRALTLAATYLGSLPSRPRTDPGLKALRQVPGFTGPMEKIVSVDTITPRAQPILMWRSAPWSDVQGRRLSYLAARILERRMREEIREKHGLTYSTATYARPAKDYPAMSALYIQFTTDPDKTREAVQLARAVVETFATEGPTDDEMETVRRQMRHMVESMLQEPPFWVNLLSDLDYHDTNLEDVHGLLDKLMAYTKDDITMAIKQTVQPERFALVIGEPK